MAQGPSGITEIVLDFYVCPRLNVGHDEPTNAVVYGTPVDNGSYDPSGCYGVDVQIVNQNPDA